MVGHIYKSRVKISAAGCIACLCSAMSWLTPAAGQHAAHVESEVHGDTSQEEQC